MAGRIGVRPSSSRVNHLQPNALADGAGGFGDGFEIDSAVFPVEQAVELGAAGAMRSIMAFLLILPARGIQRRGQMFGGFQRMRTGS